MTDEEGNYGEEDYVSRRRSRSRPDSTPPSGQNFYYLVRVVSKGTFRAGPASADAMYNGSYHSQTEGRTITVTDAGPAQRGL